MSIGDVNAGLSLSTAEYCRFDLLPGQTKVYKIIVFAAFSLKTGSPEVRIMCGSGATCVAYLTLTCG